MCYQLPALLAEGTAIIISPLIALMKNQVDAIRNFGTELGIAHFMNSSLSKAEIKAVKEDLLNGKTKLLYVAPETLTKEENIEFFKDIHISFFPFKDIFASVVTSVISGFCSSLHESVAPRSLIIVISPT